MTSAQYPLADYGIAFRAMASRGEVRVCAPDEDTARRWAQPAIDEVRRIEQKYSRYLPDSFASRINAAAGGAPVAIDDETHALLAFGHQLHAQSEGRFDLTSGVLRRAWDFQAQRVPTPAEVDALRIHVGWSAVELEAAQVRLPRAGMQIDFGGIGKEYAADRAAAALIAAGARHGFVNLGGDVRGIGAAPDGSAWRIGIQHPRAAGGEMIGAIDVTTGAVATSGDYERYFEHDGRRYCHLLDARTGWPVEHWQSVSVAAPLCTAAGVCSTIAMLMPVDEALGFLRAQQVQFLAVAADGTVHKS